MSEVTLDWVPQRGIAVCTFNRAKNLSEVLDAVVKSQPSNAKLVLCDDGSTDDTSEIAKKFPQFVYIRGKNLGVIANKNRALFSLQNCPFLAILEDDLIPTAPGWFEIYEAASLATGIHHFCRVQDKELPEVYPDFAAFMAKRHLTPIYGPSPRGDLTFITAKALNTVGAFNPNFVGAGYGHGEWSNRIAKAGLIPHPAKWVDIKEARDLFIQKGDEEGGRWDQDKKEIKQQLKVNRAIQKKLKAIKYLYYPLELY